MSVFSSKNLYYKKLENCYVVYGLVVLQSSGDIVKPINCLIHVKPINAPLKTQQKDKLIPHRYKAQVMLIQRKGMQGMFNNIFFFLNFKLCFGTGFRRLVWLIS